MSVQFDEHKDGRRSNDPRIVKLDKLAKMLKVVIHIDGIPYGKETKDSKNVDAGTFSVKETITVKAGDTINAAEVTKNGPVSVAIDVPDVDVSKTTLDKIVEKTTEMTPTESVKPEPAKRGRKKKST